MSETWIVGYMIWIMLVGILIIGSVLIYLVLTMVKKLDELIDAVLKLAKHE